MSTSSHDPLIEGDSDLPFLAQHWYSGQGDPLYALGSSGWPQPLSTVVDALHNAKLSDESHDKYLKKKYGRRLRAKLYAWQLDKFTNAVEREDAEATEEIGQLVYGLENAVRSATRRDPPKRRAKRRVRR